MLRKQTDVFGTTCLLLGPTGVSDVNWSTAGSGLPQTLLRPRAMTSWGHLLLGHDSRLSTVRRRIAHFKWLQLRFDRNSIKFQYR